MRGVHLPLITPFRDGAVDLESLTALVRHYAGTGIDGIILLGTTGEAPTVEPAEQEAVVATTLDAAGHLPVHVGVSGNSTRHVAAAVRVWESTPVAGYLVVTPYYNRRSSDGLVEHFRAVAGETDRTVIVYNIPYRTGANLPNDALLGPRRLAAPLARLVKNRWSSPVMAKQELVRAREAWRTVAPLIPSLFAESNPMPLKHCLWRLGLIRSPECRLPLTQVSAGTARTLDALGAALPED